MYFFVQEEKLNAIPPLLRRHVEEMADQAFRSINRGASGMVKSSCFGSVWLSREERTSEHFAFYCLLAETLRFYLYYVKEERYFFVFKTIHFFEF